MAHHRSFDDIARVRPPKGTMLITTILAGIGCAVAFYLVVCAWLGVFKVDWGGEREARDMAQIVKARP